MVHKYFVDFLTHGNENAVPEIFSDDIVHVDEVWAAAHPTVGVEAMKHYIHDLKQSFPDFWVEIREIATCDTNQIWVSYEGAATGLGEYHGHRATHHTSSFSGVNIFKFNEDRSKIIEAHGEYVRALKEASSSEACKFGIFLSWPVCLLFECSVSVSICRRPTRTGGEGS